MSHVASPPADRRTSRRVSAFLLYFGLLAPPLAWSLQENLGFGLASHACFPYASPLASFLKGYSGVWTTILTVNLALLLAGVAGLATSWLAWRHTRPVAQARDDAHDNLMAPGEDRIRVFAASGFLVSALFAIAIGVNTLSLLTLSTCSQA